MARRMQFKRGDGCTHYFKIPADNWSAGGTLWFAAKSAIDDDLTDAAAAINKSFSDSVVTDETIDGVAYKTYTLDFVAADTSSLVSEGKKSKTYLGEFQFVPASGPPVSYPGNDNFLEVVVYFDVKRATS